MICRNGIIDEKCYFQTFLGDFSKEQEKFVTEKKEKSKQAEAAVPPWVGYNEEESMKAQILALSQVRLSLSLSLSLTHMCHIVSSLCNGISIKLVAKRNGIEKCITEQVTLMIHIVGLFCLYLVAIMVNFIKNLNWHQKDTVILKSKTIFTS